MAPGTSAGGYRIIKRMAIDIVSTRELFIKERDPIELIKMKEIYGELKDILNSCENAADCVQVVLQDMIPMIN